MKKLFSVILLLFLTINLASCNILDQINPKYRVSFYDDEVLYKELEVKKDTILENLLIEKEGFQFLGWYKDNEVWNFNNKVTGHLKLTAKWELKINYLQVENIKLEDDKISFDKIDNAAYKIEYLNKTIETTDNFFYITHNVEEGVLYKINVIKENYESIEQEILIKYEKEKVIETKRIDFEPFDFDDFKELNRSTFKSNEINIDDFHLYINEGRLTKENEQPKYDNVALILREDGFIEIKESFPNFEKLEFSLAGFNVNILDSNLDLYVKNAETDYILVKNFKITEPNFVKFTLYRAEIELTGDLYFKFVANIIKTGSLTSNIVIDDIIIYEKELPSYVLSFYEQFELGEYYKTLENLKGYDLLNELRIILGTNLNDVRYKDIKEILEFADINQDNPNLVIGIYDLVNHKANWGNKSEWHREHVWPNSRLGMDRVKESDVNQGSDPHNLRAITPSTNSSRSNRYYNEKTDESNILGHTLKTNEFYPGDADIGDVARILMYMVVRYEFLGLTNNLELLGRKAYTIEAAYMGLLSNLLAWHLKDPVDDFEIYRNEIIYSYQNNRNPFIDHPELFQEIYDLLVEIDNNRKISFTFDNMYVDISFFKRRVYI